MKLPIYQIDAFTSNRFSGNPAAVVLLEQWLPDQTLRAVAAENNLSETAFLMPEGDIFELRWFTPLVEVDLCGHATLASGHVLFETGKVTGDRVSFRTKSGRLHVHRSGNLLSLDFPSRPPSPLPCPAELIEALGAHPVEVLGSERDTLVIYESEEQVASLSPDFQQMVERNIGPVIASAAGRHSDFVSRFFGPTVGIPEDPVTGSAHCVLTPYWSRELGKQSMKARQISRRGGELICENHGERVRISGHAVEYLRGEITI